ncbi:MAG: hypothetical protein ACR2PZ_19635 [Pseudomonadales bacterium]
MSIRPPDVGNQRNIACQGGIAPWLISEAPAQRKNQSNYGQYQRNDLPLFSERIDSDSAVAV